MPQINARLLSGTGLFPVVTCTEASFFLNVPSPRALKLLSTLVSGQEKREILMNQVAGFKGQTQKCYALILPTFHWLEFNHMTPPNSKGDWEMWSCYYSRRIKNWEFGDTQQPLPSFEFMPYKFPVDKRGYNAWKDASCCFLTDIPVQIVPRMLGVTVSYASGLPL